MKLRGLDQRSQAGGPIQWREIGHQFLRLSRAIVLSGAYLAAFAVTSLFTQSSRRPRLLGSFLARYLVRMGPLYIKLGQVLATRSDILAEDTIAELRQLHDDCPASRGGYIRALLRRRYGAAFEQRFGSFDFHPVASGSIAQVHCAYLAEGQKVAVKIVKENVRRSLSSDLAVARGVIGCIHVAVPAVRRIRLRQSFVEIEALLIRQTDLHQELLNQQQFGQLFAKHPFIHIPGTYPDLSDHDILVMEFVDAIPGRDWRKVALSPAILAQRLQLAVNTMLHLKGTFHADPHPGNLFFTADGAIIPVDYGIVGHISEDEKWGLSSFFYACTQESWDLAARRLTQYFIDTGDRVDVSEALLDELSLVLQRHFGRQSTKWSTFGFVNDARIVLRAHGARLTTVLTQAAFMVFTGEGFINQIAPELAVWENCRLFTDRMSPFMSEEIKARFDQLHWSNRLLSRGLHDRAKKSLVAPTHLDRYVVPSRYPLFIQKALGSKLLDCDGNTLIDLSCGYGPHILGYAHPVIVDAIALAAANGGVNALATESEVLLAEDLTAAFMGADVAVFCNSGTEAAMQAIRICRAYRNRDRVAKFEGHYHGWSDQGLVSSWFRFSGPVDSPTPVAPHGVPATTIDGTLVLCYGSESSFEALYEHGHELACVICEPMPAGLARYDRAFLKKLRDCCDEIGVPLIFDEVVSGFRVAYGGIQTITGIVPDLTCLGKIIGGGLPCGAVVGKAWLIESIKPSHDPFLDYETKAFVGGTMSGNSIVCAAGHAMLTYLRDHPILYTELEAKTRWLVSTLTAAAAERQVPFAAHGMTSILSLRFADSYAPRSTREQHQGGYFKANVALACYMRQHGCYMPELHHLMLGAAHTCDDLNEVVSAFSASVADMRRDGLFVN